MGIGIIGCGGTFSPALKLGEPGNVAREGYLRGVVHELATVIGERNLFRPEGLTRARDWIESQLKASGYVPQAQSVVVDKERFGTAVAEGFNIIAEKPGTNPELPALIVGAHYDSKVATDGWHSHGPAIIERSGTPGANDNATGVGAVLEIARALKDLSLERTVIFVLFVNEEPPFMKVEGAMGSTVYARSLAAESKRVLGAVVFDCIGVFSARERTKRRSYGPLPTLVGLPSSTSYVAFLSNLSSRRFVASAAEFFAKESSLETRARGYPAISSKVAWSDDWSFWQVGIPAFTITDTAFLRSDDYHELSDTAEMIDYREYADVVSASLAMVRGLAGEEDRSGEVGETSR